VDIHKYFAQNYYMYHYIKYPALSLASLFFVSCQTTYVKNKPSIQTKEAIIYLADNLDEKDKLGWCIDTDGKGFSDRLQAHSCKPEGNDVLFHYDVETLQICSVTYPGYCAAMIGGAKEDMTISLVKSNSDSLEQKFIYDKQSGEFRPKSNPSLCLAVAQNSDSAGPYMSRKLTLKPLLETERKLKQWVIKK